jgi:CheY-like chemotaxis protein/nitrogen-specific signal transduction histidine kinase
MESDGAVDESLRIALAAVTAERDRLREALCEAEAVHAALCDEAGQAKQVKAEFMARMTHELRTPLSAIIGLASLAGPLAVDPKLRDYLEKITASARGLLGVIDDITGFVRMEKGLTVLVPVPFDLAEVLARVAGRFAHVAGAKGLSFDVARDPRVPGRLVGDDARLESVLAHLVGNAVKFTEKGAVRLDVTLVRRQEGRVRLGFAVSDTGIGMDAAVIPAMFESFTQGDGSLSRPYGGTGLGLALVRRGVALLGGELAIASSPGQGTRFFFEAAFDVDATATPPPPACAQSCVRAGIADKKGAPQQDASATMGPLTGSLILVVEDNAINRQVAREVLEGFGAAVDTAENGLLAVERVRQSLYDAVLMDVQMPVMDGLAATRAIRQLPGGGDLPIVALTAHALAEDRLRCLEAGMNDYLTKPLDAGRLLASLGQWIAPAAAAARDLATAAAPAAKGEAGAPAVGLDATRALERLGGNERLLYGIAAEFAREYAASGEEIAARIAAGDLDGARRLAHTVKGVAGNIAAEALAGAARDLEAALGRGRMPDEALLQAYAAALEPAVEDALALASRCEAAPECALTGCWKILLVDDAKLNRSVFSQMLRSAGHEVVTAENGKDACRVLFGQKTLGRPFDCILMDIEMPEMDGPAAVRVIRNLLAASVNPPCPPTIPIVALTSHDAQEETRRCRDAGMDACLHKNFDREALLAALERVMAGRKAGKTAPTVVLATKKDAARLATLLRRLAGHLAVGSIRADEDVAALRQALAGQGGAARLEALARAVERYDFAAAQEALRALARDVGMDAAALDSPLPDDFQED